MSKGQGLAGDTAEMLRARGEGAGDADEEQAAEELNYLVVICEYD